MFGKENALVRIQHHNTDPGRIKVSHVAVPEDAVFIIVNTHAKHELKNDPYNERREACEQGRDMLSERLGRELSGLCGVTLAEFEDHKKALPEAIRGFCRHAVEEDYRVKQVGELDDGDLEESGDLMNLSQRSSEVNFQNSCEELNWLTAKARKIEGVHGARLSGGGFGGDVLVQADAELAEEVAGELGVSYQEKYGETYPDFDPKTDVMVVKPGGPANNQMLN